MPRGSGAIVVHRHLSERIDGYKVRAFDPRLEMLPLLLRRLRMPDARIVHTTPDCGTAFAAPGQRFVVTFHNFVLDSGMTSYASFLQRFHYRTDLRWKTLKALGRADVVTAVSRYTADAVESYFDLKQPVHVIENGVDTEHFSPAGRLPRSPVIVLVSGNASKRKGTHFLREIALRLAPGIEIVCTLDVEECRKWVGNAENIRAIGKRASEEMPDLYRSADILLMPTAREGFGLAVAEAMACGLPVVASDRSTMPWLVDHGRGGFICPLEEPAAFAARINELAAFPEMRARMGTFNRKVAEKRFSIDTMVGHYRELFSQLDDRASRTS